MVVKALRGTALLRVELVLVLAELDPIVAFDVRTFVGGVNMPEEGV
jgi:hypothetical protein